MWIPQKKHFHQSGKWATCGLRISDNPTSDNRTPQETTKQDALDMGPDALKPPMADQGWIFTELGGLIAWCSNPHW